MQGLSSPGKLAWALCLDRGTTEEMTHHPKAIHMGSLFVQTGQSSPPTPRETRNSSFRF